MAMIVPRRFSQFDLASRAALLSLGSNAALMVAKLTIGFVFGSIAVLSDGIDSAQDVFSSGLAFFAVRLAMQPADDSHPYGHGKAESLAALSQATLIAGGAAFITVAAARRIAVGGTGIDAGPSLIMMAIAACANLGVAAYAHHAARATGSVAIAADARHLITNIIQAVGVIVALTLVTTTGNEIFDPVVALVIAAYLAYTAARIVIDALQELVDAALPPDDVAQIESCLATHGHGVRGFHAIRTRKSGREKHIDLHVLVDPQMSVSDAHLRIEEIETDLRRIIPGAIVAIHVDPDEDDIMERCMQAPPQDRPLHLHRH